MTNRPLLFKFLLATVLASTIGCSGTSDSSGASAPALGFEGQGCSTAADCMTGLACAVGQSGRSVCTRTCNEPYGFLVAMNPANVSSAACWNGLETSCDQLPGDSTCGCGCETGLYCALSADQTTGQCAHTRQTGVGCDADVECSSGICFTPDNGSADAGAGGTSICSVPLGGSCFADDCDVCLDDDPSASWCSADCTMRRCPAGSICLSTGSYTIGNAASDCYTTCSSTAECQAGTSCQAYQANASGELSSTGACQTCTFDAPCE